MKKFVTFTILMCVFVLSNMTFAQITESGDTLIIGPQNHDGSPVGALNYYINSDTLTDGSRAHSVYKILRGETYILTNTIFANFPLVLVADAPDDENMPPVIRAGLRDDGTVVAPLMDIGDDWTMKNVYMSGIVPTGDASISWFVVQVTKPYASIDLNGCVFENVNAGWCFIHNYFGGTNATFKIQNCTVRNSLNSGGTWAGTFLGLGVTDSLIFRNNTFFNVQGPVYTCTEVEGTAYIEFEHNTIANSVVHQFVSNKPVECYMNNNIFYNCYSLSGGPTEISKHPDKEIHGIIHFFLFDPEVLDTTWSSYYDPNGDGTLEESERKFELKNNAWFYSQDIEDYWANNDTVAAQSWYCNAVQEYFVNNETEKEVTIVGGASDGSDTTWTYAPHPLMVEENTTNADPEFANTGGSEALLKQNLESIREAGPGVLWHYETDGSLIQFEWPLPEDLSYTNASMLTGGTDGKPLGDLNWFKGTVGVEQKDEIIPNKYRLSQNYPNPFNPSTVIEFAIPVKNDVTLDVFNTLGQKVATLVNKELNAGSYKYDFDASQLSSGVYFYTIKAGSSFVQSKKMLLLK
ncbi:MAG: T9SS type A sorting domain-containing protein [Bacteroidota bacterium]